MTNHRQIVQALIQRARKAWLEGDAEGFAKLFSADGEFIVPSQKWQGTKAITKAFQDYAQTHTVQVIEIRNIVIEQQHALVEWYWRDLERSTGEVNEAEDAIAVDVEHDFIRRWREYIDADSLASSAH